MKFSYPCKSDPFRLFYASDLFYATLLYYLLGQPVPSSSFSELGKFIFLFVFFTDLLAPSQRFMPPRDILVPSSTRCAIYEAQRDFLSSLRICWLHWFFLSRRRFWMLVIILYGRHGMVTAVCLLVWPRVIVCFAHCIIIISWYLNVWWNLPGGSSPNCCNHFSAVVVSDSVILRGTIYLASTFFLRNYLSSIDMCLVLINLFLSKIYIQISLFCCQV